MKKQRFETKLKLKKLTIAHLNRREMRAAGGGCVSTTILPPYCKDVNQQVSDDTYLPGSE